jgi:hypothetical protein
MTWVQRGPPNRQEINCNLHVSCDGQFVERQPSLGLHGPEGANAIEDKRVWDGRILEALSSTPFFK